MTRKGKKHSAKVGIPFVHWLAPMCYTLVHMWPDTTKTCWVTQTLFEIQTNKHVTNQENTKVFAREIFTFMGKTLGKCKLYTILQLMSSFSSDYFNIIMTFLLIWVTYTFLETDTSNVMRDVVLGASAWKRRGNMRKFVRNAHTNTQNVTKHHRGYCLWKGIWTIILITL